MGMRAKFSLKAVSRTSLKNLAGMHIFLLKMCIDINIMDASLHFLFTMNQKHCSSPYAHPSCLYRASPLFSISLNTGERWHLISKDAYIWQNESTKACGYV